MAYYYSKECQKQDNWRHQPEGETAALKLHCSACDIKQETHVQYTQTDTIRQTDGPLVPMVRLVPIEKHPIPMVLLVNMHLIKRT